MSVRLAGIVYASVGGIDEGRAQHLVATAVVRGTANEPWSSQEERRRTGLVSCVGKAAVAHGVVATIDAERRKSI